jgi:threonyl-tRNA synthetase
VSEKFLAYAGTVHARLREAGLRAELDTRDEKLGFKIREAQLQKVPYMLVVGAREEEQGTVAVRLRTEEDLGGMAPEALVARLEEKVASRSHEL